jgi:hypothetical protein
MESINPHVPSVALFVTVSNYLFLKIVQSLVIFKRSEIDFSHRSPSPICQRWFMVLYLKSEAKELALTVNIHFYY